jgi:hypothetical protein
VGFGDFVEIGKSSRFGNRDSMISLF